MNGTDASPSRPLSDCGRVLYVDYVKALGLIGVLCAHLELPRGILAPFELPIFFLASGMLFRDRGDSFGATAARFVKKLLVPYWLAMIVYGAFEMARAQILGYSDERIVIPALINMIYGGGIVPEVGSLRALTAEIQSYHVQSALPVIDVIMPTSCHLWFLPAMFSGVLIFTAVSRHRDRLPDAAWIVLLLVSSCVEFIPGFPPLPYGLSRGALVAAYMLAGQKILESGIVTTRGTARTVAAVASLVIVFAALAFETTNTVWIRHHYGPYGAASMAAAFAMGISASFLALLVCRALELHPIEPINTVLSTISRHSMMVYMWHMIVYNILYALYVTLTGADIVPDPFWMNLFTTGHYPFRIAALVATLALLTAASIALSRAKSARRG